MMLKFILVFKGCFFVNWFVLGYIFRGWYYSEMFVFDFYYRNVLYIVRDEKVVK